MKKQRVFLDKNKVVGLDGKKRLCMDLGEIEMVFRAIHGSPYIAFPEVFSMLLAANKFFLIGPEVENSWDIVEEIKQAKSNIPFKKVEVEWAIRWRLRHKGRFGWRLFPTPGFGIFPLKFLPEYEIVEEK